MQFFIDTADINEIKELQSWGVVNGVTTNPSLIAKTGLDRNTVIASIADVIDGPISAEVIATDFEGMIGEAKELSAIHENIVCLLYTSPSPRDATLSRMPSSA